MGTGLMPAQVPTCLGAADADPGEHREWTHDPPPPHWWVSSREGTEEERTLETP